MVLAQQIGSNGQVTPAHHSIALGEGFNVGTAAHLLSLNGDRQLLGCLAFQRRLDLVEQLELDTPVGGQRPPRCRTDRGWPAGARCRRRLGRLSPSGLGRCGRGASPRQWCAPLSPHRAGRRGQQHSPAHETQRAAHLGRGDRGRLALSWRTGWKGEQQRRRGQAGGWPAPRTRTAVCASNYP